MPAPTLRRALSCPSAQPGMQRLRVIGVITRDAGDARVAYVNEPVEATPDVLALSGEAKPSQVFRLAGQCETRRCVHYDGDHCQLARRIVTVLPAVVEQLPFCTIRSTCRWYQEQRGAACLRCPQVVTLHENPSAEFEAAALPPGGDSTKRSG